MRNLIVALAASFAVSLAVMPGQASADWQRGGGGWHEHGGWHDGWHGSGRGLYRPHAYRHGYYHSGGCYRTVHVGTPWGWRWRRIWVCG